MLNGLMKRKNELLESEIARVHAAMQGVGVDSEEYEIMTARFEKLMKLQTEVKGSGVDPNTVLVVTTNILGILIIVGYERAHVIASRGLQFLIRTS